MPMLEPDDQTHCPYCPENQFILKQRLQRHLIRSHSEAGKPCLLDPSHIVTNVESHYAECSALRELEKDATHRSGVCTVPEPPPIMMPTADIEECWDDYKDPTYNPLEGTRGKSIIRYSYAAGAKPAEKKQIQREEIQRYKEIENDSNKGNVRTKTQNNFQSESHLRGLACAISYEKTQSKTTIKNENKVYSNYTLSSSYELKVSNHGLATIESSRNATMNDSVATTASAFTSSEADYKITDISSNLKLEAQSTDDDGFTKVTYKQKKGNEKRKEDLEFDTKSDKTSGVQTEIIKKSVGRGRGFIHRPKK